MRKIESFLPTYKTVRLWKNRQRIKLELPLFPGYLFVRIASRDQVKVLQCPGVLHVIGNGSGPIALPDREIEALRLASREMRIEPYRELVLGEKVRIKSGLMRGVEGTLVRKDDSFRFVLMLQLSNQHAAIHVDAEDLEAAHEPAVMYCTTGARWQEAPN